MSISEKYNVLLEKYTTLENGVKDMEVLLEKEINELESNYSIFKNSAFIDSGKLYIYRKLLKTIKELKEGGNVEII